MKIANITEHENVYLMVKGDEELEILTSKDFESPVNIQETIRKTTVLAQFTQKALSRQNVYQVLENQDLNNDPEETERVEEIYTKIDFIVKLDAFFVRRGNLYLVDKNGTLKTIKSQDVVIQNPLKRMTRIAEPRNLVELKDLSMHLGYFSDFLVANTAILISHGKILSIYDFKMQKWSHILPNEQGNQNTEDKQGF